MKKQINPTIKAHLIRSAFYLLLLLAVCAIPFALAQSRSRGTSKRTVINPAANLNAPAKANPLQNAPPSAGAIPSSAQAQLPNAWRTDQSQLPTTSNVAAAGLPIFVPINPRMPAQPNVVLYDQINNPAPTPAGVTSQDFEAVNDAFDSFTADDFVVPAGQTWNITEVDVAGEYSTGGPAASFHVFFYADSATLPGALVATRLANPYVGGANAMITLTSAVTLTPGTYWVAVQARQDFTPAGQWFWDNRLVILNAGAAWQNPAAALGPVPHLGPQDSYLPIQNGAGPTIPARWDDSQRYSNAYSGQ